MKRQQPQLKPIATKQTNITLVASGCDDLPATITDKGIASCWTLTIGERIRILFTGRIWLHAATRQHPPVFLTTYSPFIEEKKI